MFAEELVTSVVQVLGFSLVPFIVHLIGRRTARGFWQEIGFYRPEKRTVLFILLASAVMFLVAQVSFFATGNSDVLQDETTVVGKLRAAGFSFDTVLSLLVIAWIKTSLSEEILFRGFIGKRLIRRFGFQAGNLVQAAVFAAVHGILFAVVPANTGSAWALALIILLTGAAGWIFGWIKEKRGNGSIVPSWIAHGLGNTVAFSLGAFVL